MCPVRVPRLAVYPVLGVCLTVGACAKTDPAGLRPDFDAQGHRGARGLYPENSLTGFAEALRLGVRTLELDVVVSADSQVVVSHEPFFRTRICELQETGYNEATPLFGLPYAAIRSVPCGVPDVDFPYQRRAVAPKPLLSEVLAGMDRLADSLSLPRPSYNIELKARPEWEGTHVPSPEAFVELVLRVVRAHVDPERVLFQAFGDPTLLALHRADPSLRIGFITEYGHRWRSRVDALGFDPEACIAYHLFLTPSVVDDLQAYGVRVLPWTVNDPSRMRELIGWGVDGIITDYPDRLATVLNSYPP